jgi:hypothetical protein
MGLNINCFTSLLHILVEMNFKFVYLCGLLLIHGNLRFVTVEDVSDLWLNVKESFEQRLPVKKACLNNKARNPVFVENLPAEFIQTTDSRLRSRFPQDQYLFWFREPYATVVLVSCEVLSCPHACCSF